jgi:hypothetical protein
MNPAYEQHFDQLKGRLSVCLKADGEPIWIFLKATAITRHYRRQLPLPGVSLTPVDYFKGHLPVFEAECQYYNLRYEAECHRPSDSHKTWADFWLEEAGRMQRQIDAEPVLYDYYRRGAADRDAEYFGGDPALGEQNAVFWGAFMALTRYQQDLETIFTHFLNT